MGVQSRGLIGNEKNPDDELDLLLFEAFDLVFAFLADADEPVALPFDAWSALLSFRALLRAARTESPKSSSSSFTPCQLLDLPWLELPLRDCGPRPGLLLGVVALFGTRPEWNRRGSWKPGNCKGSGGRIRLSARSDGPRSRSRCIAREAQGKGEIEWENGWRKMDSQFGRPPRISRFAPSSLGWQETGL